MLEPAQLRNAVNGLDATTAPLTVREDSPSSRIRFSDVSLFASWAGTPMLQLMAASAPAKLLL